jgi:hypothetical protein
MIDDTAWVTAALGLLGRVCPGSRGAISPRHWSVKDCTDWYVYEISGKQKILCFDTGIECKMGKIMAKGCKVK